jgi:hypothetical protein
MLMSLHLTMSVISASTVCQQSINRASTILGVASCMIQALCYGISPYSTYWQPLWAKENVTWSQPRSENERQQSFNGFVWSIMCHLRALLRLLSIIEVLVAFLGKIVNVDVASPDNECQQYVNSASTEHQLSINRASTILGVASCMIQGLRYGIYP